MLAGSQYTPVSVFGGCRVRGKNRVVSTGEASMHPLTGGTEQGTDRTTDF